MLRFVFGRSGSGKTRAVRLALKEKARAGGERLMLIVPEQASFENERAMLRLLGAREARRVSVTSFSRLVDAVQRRCGGALAAGAAGCAGAAGLPAAGWTTGAAASL